MWSFSSRDSFAVGFLGKGEYRGTTLRSVDLQDYYSSLSLPSSNAHPHRTNEVTNAIVRLTSYSVRYYHQINFKYRLSAAVPASMTHPGLVIHAARLSACGHYLIPGCSARFKRVGATSASSNPGSGGSGVNVSPRSSQSNLLGWSTCACRV